MRIFTSFLLIFTIVSVVSAQPKTNIRRDLQTALGFERAKKYDKALDIYLALEKNYPNNQGVFEGIQRCYSALKMYEKQILFLQNRLEYEPDNVSIYEWLGRTYILSGDTDVGKKYWEKIIEIKPEDESAYKRVANLYYRNGFLEDAVSTYKKIREIKKDDSLFAIELAGVYEFQMNYSGAISEYLRYLNSNPRQFSYISGKIIRLCEKEKIWDEATTKIQEALATNPKNYDLHKLLGDIYLRSGKSDLGLNQYLLYEDKTKSKGKNLFEYARRCEEEGEYETAIAAYDVIIARDLERYKDRAILRKAAALVGLERYQEALDTYDILISQKKKSQYTSEAYLGIGDVYLFRLRETEHALKAYEDLLKTFPYGRHSILAHFRIADLYYMENQTDKAREEYRKIDKMAESSDVREKALFELANLELLEGNIDEAAKLLTDMLKRYPKGKYVNDALKWSIFIEQNQQEGVFGQYINGLKHIKQMKYDLAISDFENLLKNSPQSALADNSYLELAEIHIKTANYEKAIATYRELIDKYPESELLAQAQMKIGDVYSYDLSDYRSAKTAYENVILNYPQSIQADLVRKKIEKFSGKIQ